MTLYGQTLVPTDSRQTLVLKDPVGLDSLITIRRVSSKTTHLGCSTYATSFAMPALLFHTCLPKQTDYLQLYC